ncbi:hypothetical protein [Nocardia wallacei]|uniref:hypothetical protein n=1 Tax=Nocardia wallacei TaxID=480035 RepID=UPI0024538E49|nr:hypothetical protein [Nocardia wallacei]
MTAESAVGLCFAVIVAALPPPTCCQPSREVYRDADEDQSQPGMEPESGVGGDADGGEHDHA